MKTAARAGCASLALKQHEATLAYQEGKYDGVNTPFGRVIINEFHRLNLLEKNTAGAKAGVLTGQAMAEANGMDPKWGIIFGAAFSNIIKDLPLPP